MYRYEVGSSVIYNYFQSWNNYYQLCEIGIIQIRTLGSNYFNATKKAIYETTMIANKQFTYSIAVYFTCDHITHISISIMANNIACCIRSTNSSDLLTTPLLPLRPKGDPYFFLVFFFIYGIFGLCWFTPWKFFISPLRNHFSKA